MAKARVMLLCEDTSGHVNSRDEASLALHWPSQPWPATSWTPVNLGLDNKLRKRSLPLWPLAVPCLLCFSPSMCLLVPWGEGPAGVQPRMFI